MAYDCVFLNWNFFRAKIVSITQTHWTTPQRRETITMCSLWRVLYMHRNFRFENHIFSHRRMRYILHVPHLNKYTYCASLQDYFAREKNWARTKRNEFIFISMQCNSLSLECQQEIIGKVTADSACQKKTLKLHIFHRYLVQYLLSSFIIPSFIVR